MLLKRTILLLLALGFTSPLHAQKTPPASAYFSVDGGIYVVPARHFEAGYGRSYGSVIGVEAGFPFSRRLYLHGRYSFLFKELGESVDLKLSNVGLKYAIPVFDIMKLEILGGLFRIDGERDTPNSGNPPGKEKGAFAFGGYLGMGVEKNLPNLPIALSAQFLRHMNHEVVTEWLDDFSGARITVGVRYYLPPPGRR
jgi:hypothetical protein